MTKGSPPVTRGDLKQEAWAAIEAAGENYEAQLLAVADACVRFVTTMLPCWS